jgi:5'-deoxynucleotidase YfbR-like HD superfamily hydrolase
MIFNKDYLLRTYKLKNLIRYNHKTKLTSENVAEHSYFVSLFTLELCDYFKLSDDIKLNCLIKAILHDAPETEINDITYDVKATNPALKNILENLESKFYLKYYKRYASLLESHNSPVDKIVKLADLYSVLQFTTNELELGNHNKEMENIHKDAQARITKLEEELIQCL